MAIDDYASALSPTTSKAVRYNPGITWTDGGYATSKWWVDKYTTSRLHEVTAQAVVSDRVLESHTDLEQLDIVKLKLAHDIARQLIERGMIELESERMFDDQNTIFYAKVRVADNKKNNEVETLGKITTST